MTTKKQIMRVITHKALNGC